MNRIQVLNVSKSFGRRVLFRSLSFTVEGGRRFGVAGANGTGKSTLLKMTAGLLRPATGSIEFVHGDQSISPDDRPLYTGLIAPYLNLYDGLTLRENLEFIARTRRLDGADRRLIEILGQTEMERRADDLVYTFSSGMKQRARFAVALLTSPPLLLLDEPTTNLDETGIRMVETIITSELDRGKIIIVASNDNRDLDRCDDLVRIEEFRRPQEVVRS